MFKKYTTWSTTYDPTKKDSMTLYGFDGVRYTSRSANTAANMELAAETAAKDAVSTLLRCGPLRPVTYALARFA